MATKQKQNSEAGSEEAAAIKVYRKKNNIYRLPVDSETEIIFYPGTNIIAKEKYDAVMANPSTKRTFEDLLKNRVHRLLKGDDIISKSDVITGDVNELNIEEAVAAIQKVLSVKQLLHIRNAEEAKKGRKGVLSAIDARVEALKNDALANGVKE